MFGLSKKISLDFIIGCQLQQIAFSSFQLTLNFSNNVSIYIESICRLESRDKCMLMVWQPGNTSELRNLGMLFDAEIIGYEIPEDGSVLLHFSVDCTLKIEDTNNNYESYQITGIGHTVVV